MATPAHLIAIGLESDLNSDIRQWFHTFNYLPPLPLKADKLDFVKAPDSFEHLLEVVANSVYKNFIIIVHGFQDGSGLTIKLAHSKGKPVGSQATYGTHLQRLMDLDTPGEQPGDKEKHRLGINETEIKQLIDLMHKVRDKKIDTIEFRSCNLGKDPLSLERFRKFFGARRAGAPDLHTFFGHGPVLVGEKYMKEHRKRRGGGNWEEYNFPNALMDPQLQLCFRVNGQNKPASGYTVSRDQQVLGDWVKKYVMAGASHTGSDMPLHGLWVTGRQIFLESEDVNTPLGSWGGGNGTRRIVFPRSETYAKHIIYSK